MTTKRQAQRAAESDLQAFLNEAADRFKPDAAVLATRIETAVQRYEVTSTTQRFWICPYISRHLLSLNPLLARCRRYSRGER